MVLLVVSGLALCGGTLFFGAYPNSILVFDEAQGKVVDRIMFQTGLPTGLRLSHDRKKICAMTNDHSGIEVIDVATRKVVNSLTLNSATRKYRFNGGIADPEDKLFYTITTEMVKQIDRYEIGRPKYTVIDLNEKKVVKMVEISIEDEAAMTGGGGRGGGFAISPDGKYLYQFRDVVTVLDTNTFKEADRIELAKPDYPGIENVGFSAQLDSITEPGYYVSMFNSSDPTVHNRIFGFARLDLATRKVDFKPIGPAPPAMTGLQVSPDKSRGYVVITNNTLGNKRCEVWAFDLNSNRILKTQEIACRSRFSFGISSEGKKLYIYGAGFEFDVYDAATLKFEKTWDTNNDITGAGLVVMP